MRLVIELVADLHSGSRTLGNTTKRLQDDASSSLTREFSRETARRHYALQRWRDDLAFRREQAEALLQRRHVSTVRVNGISTLVIRSDRDGPAVRLAIQLLELSNVPVRYVDGDGIPPRLQERRRETSQQSRKREATWSPGRRRGEVGREQFNEVVRNE
jgi:hypothetical protein